MSGSETHVTGTHTNACTHTHTYTTHSNREVRKKSIGEEEGEVGDEDDQGPQGRIKRRCKDREMEGSQEGKRAGREEV